MPYSLESTRLFYEPVLKIHTQELEAILCDPQVYLHVDDGIAPTFDELQASFALREHGPPRDRQNETWVDYIVRLKETKVAIGRVEATVMEQRAEMAYLLGPAYWRQGYGSEALVWLQQYLREHHNVQQYWATVTPGNQASKALLLKHGYLDVSAETLPPLMSYDRGDWVFRRLE